MYELICKIMCTQKSRDGLYIQLTVLLVIGTILVEKDTSAFLRGYCAYTRY